MSENFEERIVELEMRFMQQESTIEDLNSVIINQQKVIEKLEKEVDFLARQIRASAQSPLRDPSEETPPPHY